MRVSSSVARAKYVAARRHSLTPKHASPYNSKSSAVVQSTDAAEAPPLPAWLVAAGRGAVLNSKARSIGGAASGEAALLLSVKGALGVANSGADGNTTDCDWSETRFWSGFCCSCGGCGGRCIGAGAADPIPPAAPLFGAGVLNAVAVGRSTVLSAVLAVGATFGVLRTPLSLPPALELLPGRENSPPLQFSGAPPPLARALSKNEQSVSEDLNSD